MRALIISYEEISEEVLHYFEKDMGIEINDCDLNNVSIEVDKIKYLRFKKCKISKCTIKTKGARILFEDCIIDNSILKDNSDKRSIEADYCKFEQCVIDSKVYLYNCMY